MKEMLFSGPSLSGILVRSIGFTKMLSGIGKNKINKIMVIFFVKFDLRTGWSRGGSETVDKYVLVIGYSYLETKRYKVKADKSIWSTDRKIVELREAAKKLFFWVDRPVRPYPPSFDFSGHILFLKLQKKVRSPPPLVPGNIKKT